MQEERYLFEVYRYIELNPVRAEMVTDPGKYRWSSYQVKALGAAKDWCTPHPEYLALAADPAARWYNYRSLFFRHIDEELLTAIPADMNKGLAFGNDRFKDEIETLTGRRIRAEKRGRPMGWRKGKT